MTAPDSGFAVLRNRNYRLYLTGQTISQVGTWMQTVGMGWLVLKLTRSGGMLGLVTAVQYIPVLLLGAFAGALADRHSRTRILMIVQVLAGVIATVIGVMVLTDSIQLWSLFALSAVFGTITAFDMPVRSSFTYEIVGPDQITSAISMGSTLTNIARIVGPAFAGAVIAISGLAAPFICNGLSFGVATIALLMMDRSKFVPKDVSPPAKGQVREGIRIVWSDPRLRTPILMTIVIGMLSYENNISLPIFAKYVFDTGPGGYGLLSSSMGVGAALGGIVISRFGRATHRRIGWAALMLGMAMLVAAVMPTMGTMMFVLLFCGAGSVYYLTSNSATLQLSSPAEARGRVMAIHVTAIIGTTPIGGPIIGWIGQHVGSRWTMITGGLAAVITAAVAWRSLGRAVVPPVSPEEERRVERRAVIVGEDLAGDRDSGFPMQMPPTEP